MYGFEKFHSYVYGPPTFVAETDHKPLIAIIKKNLSEMSPCIQRLMMKLQRYDFSLIYTPGRHIVLAGALSRATTYNDSESSTEEDVNIHIDLLTKTLPVSDMKSKHIAEEPEKYTCLQRVIKNLKQVKRSRDLQRGWLRSTFASTPIPPISMKNYLFT